MFNWKKTQLLTRLVLHGCPRLLRPPALGLFRQQNSLGKIGKEEPWTLEIISYWSDKLSIILDYFTFDPQKKSILPIQRKSQVLFVDHVLESPCVSEFRSPHVPCLHPTFSDSPITRNIHGYSLFSERRGKWRLVSRKFHKKKLKKRFLSI